MRYALMRKMDISNGTFVGASLFVQGCRFHCKNCFNQETWDFNGGKEWTQETKNTFLSLIDKPYIKRVSILGGEPLVEENVDDVVDLMKVIKDMFPDKKIWIYTGYTMEAIAQRNLYDVLSLADFIVDGRYVDSLSDISLKLRGSSNQRIWEKINEEWVDVTSSKG